jgi:hypothetical protein
MREAVQLLRPADRDRDPAGPIPRLGIAGHIDNRETAEVLLGLDERPVGEEGLAAGLQLARCTEAPARMARGISATSSTTESRLASSSAGASELTSTE